MQSLPLIWPTKDPDEVLNYLLDATSQIAVPNDGILTASVSVAPSGPGEMVASQVVASGSTVTVWLSGGYAGRIYQVKVLLTTQMGVTLEYPIVVPIDPSLASYPVVAPVSSGFGTSVTWQAS